MQAYGSRPVSYQETHKAAFFTALQVSGWATLGTAYSDASRCRDMHLLYNYDFPTSVNLIIETSKIQYMKFEPLYMPTKTIRGK